jgi:UMF1 family MFS transporter
VQRTVSPGSYAVGYLGGGVLLAIDYCHPEAQLFGLADASQASPSFAAVRVWWLLFSLPLFRRPRTSRVFDGVARGRSRCGDLDTSQYHQTFLLIASCCRGVSTVIAWRRPMGARSMPRSELIGPVLLVQFLSIRLSSAAGRQLRARGGIFLGIAIYSVASRALLPRTERGCYLPPRWWRWQGGAGAVALIFASVVPATARPSSSASSPGRQVRRRPRALLFGITVALAGSTRWAVLSVLFFFSPAVWSWRSTSSVVLAGATAAFLTPAAVRRRGAAMVEAQQCAPCSR